MKNDKKHTILVVDDTPENVDILVGVLKEKYKVKISRSGEEAIQLATKKPPELILLDIMMPGIDGYETCRRLKANPATVKIPVIFVTAMDEVANERHGFEIGGVDYITKPISAPILLSRVSTHLALYNQQQTSENLVLQRTFELEKSQKAAISMLGEAGHYNDTDTGSHIWRMADYSEAIARAATWHVEKAAMLKLAAPMHDTGKIGIPDSILKKPAKLDMDEWSIMKTHSKIGHTIMSMSDTPLFDMAAEVALYHHEKWDGRGYPNGLKKEEIPQSARIVALADVFDALTMKRPYKEPWPVEDALDEIRKSAEKHFDPQLCECFFGVESEILEIMAKWEGS
jgi:putative two-component system response regulator